MIIACRGIEMVLLAVDWTAIGSVSTAIAAIAAFIGIVPALYVYRRQSRQSMASDIRKLVRRISNTSREIGSATGMSVAAIVDAQVSAIRQKLGSSATADTFRAVFFDEGNFVLWSAYQEACWQSPAYSHLNELWTTIDRDSSELRGAFRILYYVTRLVVAASTAMCFPSSSLRILELMRHDPEVKRRYSSMDNLDELTLAVSSELGMRVMDVWRMGFQDRLSYGQRFAEDLSNALSNLSDSSILKLALKEFDELSGDAISVDGVGELLPLLERIVPSPVLKELRSQVPQWQETYTDEYAQNKLTQLHAPEKPENMPQ